MDINSLNTPLQPLPNLAPLSIPIWANHPKSHALYAALASVFALQIKHYSTLLETAKGQRTTKGLGRTVASPFSSTLRECLVDLMRGWDELLAANEITEAGLRRSVFMAYDFYLPTLWMVMGEGRAGASAVGDELREVKRLAFCVAESVDGLRDLVRDVTEVVWRVVDEGGDVGVLLDRFTRRLEREYDRQTSEVEVKTTGIDLRFANLGI